MIYVDGVLLARDSSQALDSLMALMDHPTLVAASNSFKSVAEKKFSDSESSSSATSKARKLVYVFQREFATVDPALVDHAHPAVKSRTKLEGYSYPLCTKIIETLSKRSEKFQIRSLHVLWHNTKWDSEGAAYPIFHGFVVETSNGSIFPASFDETSRCPDEVVRRIRVTASFEDPNWTGRLLDTYDTDNDRFVIAPCTWTIRQSHIALTLRHLSDTEILLACSSSPSVEGPDFVDNERRKWDYLIRHPDWRETFPSYQPRVFERTGDGTWVKSSKE